MHLLKKILKNEKGFILPAALILLVLGSLVVIPALGLLSTSLKSNIVVQKNTSVYYAADAGMEHAAWRLMYDTGSGGLVLPAVGLSVPVGFPEAINSATVDVTLYNQGSNVYRITSVATMPDGHTTATITSYVEYSPGGSSVFNNALVSLNSDVIMTGAARVYSTPSGGKGDVYANGNVSLSNSANIDGNASATGTVTTSGGAHIGGTKTQQAPAVDAATLATRMNPLISGWETTAQSVTCATCSTNYTRTGAWTPPAGNYPNNEYVQNNMSISGSSGTWTFGGTVCVGAYVASKDFTISGSGTRTFNGPVKVGEDLIISAYGGTITFNDTVCVTRNLTISGGANVIFNGKVQVGGNLSDSQYSPGSVQLHSSLYSAGNLDLSSQAVLQSTCASGPISALNCPIYVHGYIHTANSSRLDGGQNIIADGNITIDGASQLNPGVSSIYIPFVISTGGNVTINNSGNMTKAIVYAPASSPNGSITLSGAAILTGCAVSRTVILGNSGVVAYPEEFETRTDLPVSGGIGTGVGFVIHSYKIQ